MFAGLFGGRFPDVTKVQVLAILGWVGAQAVAFGWVSNQNEKLYLSLGGTVLFSVWKLADAIIRNGRNHNPTVGHTTHQR